MKTSQPNAADLTLRAQAYRKFVDALVSRNIKPGEFVTQKKLVELTGFPLGAVREMIPRLESDGLVSTLNRRGLQVAHIDVDLVRNVYQLRLMIEKEAVIHYIRSASDEDIGKVADGHRAILKQIANTTSVPQAVADEAQALDWDFHDTIIESMHNKIVSDIYRVNSIKIRLTYQDRLRLTSQNLTRVMSEHMAVIEAIKNRDEAAAVAALAFHIETSRAVALGDGRSARGFS